MSKQRTQLKIYVLFVLSLAISSCGENIFKDAATKNSEAALIEESIKRLDEKQYDEAIEILTNQISTSRQNDPDILRLTSEAYAGKCGLDAIQYIGNVKNNTSSALFSIFYQPAVGIAVLPAQCSTATSKRVAIGVVGARSQSDNIFLTVLSMFRLGANIQAAVDTSPVNGDGTLDTSVCAMTDGQVDEVILAFGYLIENFAAISSALVGDGALGSINSLINAINSVCSPAGVQCVVTDAADIDPLMRDIFRDLLNTSEYGVGSVVTNGNPIQIGQACP